MNTPISHLAENLSLAALVLLVAYEPVAQAQNALGTQIDAYLGELADDGAFSGSVFVEVEHETVLEKGYGLANVELDVPNSAETKFRIGSITRQFTAMAILMLQEDGKLTVDDRLGVHLSGIPPSWEDLTLHQLLTHTSGLMHSWALPDFEVSMALPRSLDENLSRFHDQPLLFDPGENFSYSGLGYFVLAKVIEVVSGLPYHEFLEQRIFAPLEMNDIGGDNARPLLSNRADGYVVENGTRLNAPAIFMPILTGGVDLYSTVDDMSRRNRALNEKLLLSTQSYELFYKTELENYAYG